MSVAIKSKKSNEYFICLQSDPLKPIAWNISDFDDMAYFEYIYFGKTLEAMENKLKIKGLKFYVTWSVEELPAYGSDVVAIVLGDEWCRIPTYFDQVRAVFKCYGIQPKLALSYPFKLSIFNINIVIKFIKNWSYRLPGLLVYRLYQLKKFWSRNTESINIYDIPLSYWNQLDLPIKNFSSRTYDCFFAGSATFMKYPVWSLRHWIKTPKNIARQKMLSALNSYQQKNPQFKVELKVNSQFGFQGDRVTAAREYSEKLMNAKICLVPRGSSLETLRFFESLRYGCIVIAEKLPSRWFYDGSPAIQIRDWNELEQVLDSLIENDDLLQKLHQDSLNWWKTKCSEQAVGTYIAEKLNEN